MKYIVLLFCIVLTQNLPAQSYIDSLDVLIDQKISALHNFSTEIKDVVYCIQASANKQIALKDIQQLLDYENSLLYKLQDAIDTLSLELSFEEKQALQDLKFVVSAKVYLHYLRSSEQTMMDFALKMYQAIAYWQDAKFQATRQDITKIFFTLDYQEKIQKSLDNLQAISKKVHTYLGIITYSQSILQQAKDKEKFQQDLLSAVQIQDYFFAMPFQDYDFDRVELIVQKSLDQLSELSFEISSKYADNKLPSYAERYWQSSLAMASVVCASGCIVHNYQDRLQHFFSEHIKRPLEQNIDVLTGVVQFPQLDISENQTTLEALIESEFQSQPPLGQETSVANALHMQAHTFSDGESEKMIKKISKVSGLYDAIAEFAEQNKDTTVFGWSWAGLQNCFHLPYEKPFDSVAQFLKEDAFEEEKNIVRSTSDVSYQEKVQEVAKRDTIVLAHPIKNIEKVMPAYSRKFEREIMGIKNQANQFSKDVYVLLGLTALIPVITLVGAGLFASHKMYSSVAYTPIRTFMHDIETFLNLSLYEVSNFEREGYLYFLVEQLTLSVSVLTVHEQKVIQKDIALLQSRDLNYVQKFNIVQRMYRTYKCLSYNS